MMENILNHGSSIKISTEARHGVPTIQWQQKHQPCTICTATSLMIFFHSLEPTTLNSMWEMRNNLHIIISTPLDLNSWRIPDQRRASANLLLMFCNKGKSGWS